MIQERLNSSELDAPAYAALIAPFGSCAQYLNKDVVKPLLEPGLKSAVAFVQNLKSDDLKQKVNKSIFFLLLQFQWTAEAKYKICLRVSKFIIVCGVHHLRRPFQV